MHQPGPRPEAERITRIVRPASPPRTPRRRAPPAGQARQLPADRAVAQVAVPAEVLDLAQQLGIGDVGDERLLIGIDGDQSPTRARDLTRDLVDCVFRPGDVLEHAIDARPVERTVLVRQRPGVGLQIRTAARPSRLEHDRRRVDTDRDPVGARAHRQRAGVVSGPAPDVQQAGARLDVEQVDRPLLVGANERPVAHRVHPLGRPHGVGRTIDIGISTGQMHHGAINVTQERTDGERIKPSVLRMAGGSYATDEPGCSAEWPGTGRWR